MSWWLWTCSGSRCCAEGSSDGVVTRCSYGGNEEGAHRVGGSDERTPSALLEIESCFSDGVDSTSWPEEQEEWRSVPTELMSRRHSHVLRETVRLGDRCKTAEMAELDEMLTQRGVDTSSWGGSEEAGPSKLERLFREFRLLRRCVFAVSEDSWPIVRVVRLVKIWVRADIFGVEHALLSRMQISPDGTVQERRHMPLRRLVWRHPERLYDLADEHLRSETSVYTEDWRKGCKRTLRDRLGLSLEWQEQHLEEDVHTNGFRSIEPSDSACRGSYPGLVTLYAIHDVVFRVADPDHPGVRRLGLPSGQEFATVAGTICSDRDTAVETSNKVVQVWTWERCPQDGSMSAEVRSSCAPSPIKRVPIHTVSGRAIYDFQRIQRGDCELKPPNIILRALQEGRTTDWATVKRMSTKIRDPEYSLLAFYKDLSAFPELDLYLLDGDVVPGMWRRPEGSRAGAASSASSGRTIGDEYQRTVGAFFAIYWLLRLDGDGRNGFCFGVDEGYRPIAPDEDEDRLYPAEKRLKFFRESQWDRFDALLMDAGLTIKGRSGKVNVDANRVSTLLALTAVHDIMKVQVLLPTVAPQHKNYHGYRPGDAIGDHDHALSYIMDHFPQLLPSFNGLDREEQRSVQFTQCELCFNHGWFVQAEAPPGAIFTKFRQMLTRGKDYKASARDIALYFVHWITDLAGAEPTPLGGCEKFVIKFPLPVLNSFLNSFKTVQRIATETEVAVNEAYLISRWREHTPSLGPPPTGAAAIAKMRLVCMAQANTVPILEAFEKLPHEDRELLSAEMAMTACAGQSYSAKLTPKECPLITQGPALLIYYGPAFLQSLGSDDPVARLQVLAKVYRASRRLWPAVKDHVASYVTVRVDAIKAESLADLIAAEQNGRRWSVIRKNNNEAFVDQVAALSAAENVSCDDGPVEPLGISEEIKASMAYNRSRTWPGLP